MAYWKIALVLGVLVHLVQPRCFKCEQECKHLPAPLNGSSEVLIRCDSTDHNILAKFIDSNDFSNIKSLTLKTPLLTSLNLDKFKNVSTLDFSENNINNLILNITFNTVYLNVSKNLLTTFNSTFSQLSKLDISNNLLQNISTNILQTKDLTHLLLRNNSLQALDNFYSTSLKYFDVSYNNLTSFTLKNCPNIVEIDASHNNIKEIGINLSSVIPNIETLNLSSNVIEELKNYYFNLTNLLKLDLNNNIIKVLSHKCFYGLNRLQFLDISRNKIKVISPSTFQYLNGLIQLIVSENNELNSQDFGLLLATSHLKSVNASKTNQNKIPSSLTQSVRYLVLSSNNISQIQCGDLDSYPLLNSLDLASNNISYIEDDALGRLDFLITLNLDDNLLSVVPHTLPNNLRKLFLKNNRIKSIANNDFIELQKMNYLDLSFNKITEIKDDSLSQLFNLERLNLSGNPVINLSIGAFTGPRKLKVLDLSYLINLTKCEQALCFPVPEYNNLQELHMENSPALVSRFMKDVAALKTFRQLTILNIANSNVTSIRKDFSNYLPRLNKLNIQGNKLNCTAIKNMFTWFTITESKTCVFIITEEHSKERSAHKDSRPSFRFYKSTLVVEIANITPTAYYAMRKENTTVTEYVKNKTEADIFEAEAEFLTNEMWHRNENGAGEVEAYASETPTSHPGLLIMLVLPIALVSTCLFINYTRIKKHKKNEVHSEMDIEISNISSELW